jgi:hypothetical protein
VNAVLQRNNDLQGSRQQQPSGSVSNCCFTSINPQAVLPKPMS